MAVSLHLCAFSLFVCTLSLSVHMCVKHPSMYLLYVCLCVCVREKRKIQTVKWLVCIDLMQGVSQGLPEHRNTSITVALHYLPSALIYAQWVYKHVTA